MHWGARVDCMQRDSRGVKSLIENLKLATEDAKRLEKESDVRCQYKISEMVALMEKHKNQYDKIVEEKDAELDQCKAMEHALTSKNALLETNLANTDQEIILLKDQLKKAIEEKEKIAKEADENKIHLTREKKNKVNRVLVNL
ncbi:synaptonemal complex protein 1 [Pelobates fuscus]|uniref:synaptonemal complex protein 1 n=1 Tax=Pelobates fuscus TaxID=191477 RepID=UPI002FE4F716